MLDDRYVAGLFDGEGCVHVQPNCQMKIYLTQKDPEILYLLEKYYKGHVYKNGNVYHWQLSRKKDIEFFLKCIQPHSIIKRGQIELALRMFPLYRKPGIGQYEKTPDHIWKMREEIRDEVKRCKLVS